MKRNHEKLIKDYWRLAEKSSSPAAQFYASDLDAVKDITLANGGGLYDLVSNALMSGFMIGRRFGRREEKAK